MYLISIITVVYNGKPQIEQTIKSVIKQLISSVEYIIIDGNSTDGTKEIIEKYRNKINIFISEPDRGVYDAMNKAITRATGEFVYFINCGDELCELPLKSLKINKSADLLAFPVKIFGGEIRLPSMNWKIKITNTLPHQGVFYKNLDGLNYDLAFPTFADYALNLDFTNTKKGIKLFQSPIVAKHSIDGISNNKQNVGEFFKLVRLKSGFVFMIISKLYFKIRGFRHRFLSI